ncbi:hypothetical protein LZ24_03416 [Desulfobotulus alkaliphilus]|uniref:Uncharacterized protein n=1 Tax=Desulfobotulus alkaliphilus TaxID=622671 RepID=A0A562QZX7_9BACT|nr:hypothetical protein [Desulfobotulus alkaliphilus]TWI61750.1 hypothetical protein LZ24_03416 [Desulfobotulus alkaliphilus]
MTYAAAIPDTTDTLDTLAQAEGLAFDTLAQAVRISPAPNAPLAGLEEPIREGLAFDLTQALDLHDATAKALSKAPKFNIILWTDDKELADLVDSLLTTELLQGNRNWKAYRGTATVLLLNIMGGGYVRFHRSSRYYANLIKRYNPAGVSFKAVALVDAMIEHGYLEQTIGFQNRSTGKRMASRIKATPALLNRIPKHLKDQRIPTHPKKELIVLKDKEGNFKAYLEHRLPQVKRMRRELISYNTILKQHGFPPVHRVFNQGSWDLGGRFYGGWWQTCPKAERKAITIGDRTDPNNGEATVELDYSCLYPTLLYAEKGLELSKDAYDITGFPRNEAKKAFVVAVGAKTPKGGKQALRCADLNPELVVALLEAHAPIADSLFAGKVLELQRMDSRICAEVHRVMTAAGICCLSVHDSFIVQARHEAFLKATMEEAYRRVTGSNVLPRIG